MRGFTVIWWPPAQDDLALIWLDANLRGAVADAANKIDRELSEAPDQKGRAKHEGLRELAVQPLVVQFSIDNDDRQVTIWSVRLSHE